MNKIIHQIWYDLGNGNDVPLKYKQYQKTWIDHHPNWKYILWNEETGDLLMQKSYPEFYDIYKNVKYPIMKIDLLRYCILEKYGGMYVDIDYKCLNNFDDYLVENDQYDIHINEGMRNIFVEPICNSLLISKSTTETSNFWKLVLFESFYRIQNYPNYGHIHYVMKTTGPLLLNDILSNNNVKIEYKINILPFNQFNFCNNCQICYPSNDKKLYAVHDYVSYWNSNFWLNFRKIFSCTSSYHLIIIITAIFCIIILISCMLYKYNILPPI
jgi:mannosyltransferase OCH1-like enzyme